MPKVLSLLIKIILFTVLLIAITLGGLILYAMITDYLPEEKTSINQEGNNHKDLTDTLEVLLWNIGFAGLGAEADFFYDGGKDVRSPEAKVKAYLKGAKDYLAQQKSLDFILLQEVDINSKRSYGTNQLTQLQKVLNNFNHSLALNYWVKFIPIPFTNPMGRVKGGLVSFSKYKSKESIRYQFPGNFAWPKKLYFLDRCFLLERFPLKNGKDLVVINSHNSAYDSGNLKAGQMDYLKNILVDEYNRGNYVLVGADWNQTPPGFDNLTFHKQGMQEPISQVNIESNYLPSGWKWAFDSSFPTNRKTKEPYKKGYTFTTVIDYFLVSPNIEVLKVQCDDLDFQFSDHNPVRLKLSLKP